MNLRSSVVSPPKLLYLLALLFCLSNNGLACMCRFGGGPLCNSYWTTDAVFVGRAVHVGSSEIEFEVSETFRGKDQKRVSLRSGGSSCEFEFEDGKTYVVFANGNPLSTSKCMDTSLLETFPGGVEALRAMATAPLGGRLDGVLRELKKDYKQTWTPEAAIRGVRVTAKGPAAGTMMTDQNGAYSFTQCPGANYSVDVDLPSNLAIRLKRKVFVPERGCASMDIFAGPNTRMRVFV